MYVRFEILAQLLMSFWKGALAAESSGSAKLHSMLHSRIITAPKKALPSRQHRSRKTLRTKSGEQGGENPHRSAGAW